MPDVTPSLRASSFACPFCGALAQQTWADCYSQNPETGDHADPALSVSECFACGGETVWRRWIESGNGGGWTIERGVIIYPVSAKFGPARHEDMPADVAAVYDEASTVASLSPRSASALLRLALEVLLNDLYPEAGDLNTKIGAAVAAGLPRQVQQTMDVMRFNGNQSVHEFRSDDTPETATTLFNLLNIVVEQLISQPKQLEQLYSGLPEGVRKQVDRRDTPKDA